MIGILMTTLFAVGTMADVPKPDPKAVAELKAGKRKVANAAWWGFDPVNSTKAVQAAIDSGTKKVIIPNVGRDWIVDPINLASNQEVVFEKGVVVAARKGGFTGLNDCLFKADKKHDIVLRGYGAALAMQKPEYTKGEWRMCLELDSCTNVKVLGLTLMKSGGDGLYVGDTDEGQPYCHNILVKDCVFDDNKRQGISIISAVGMRIENCVFRNTQGTAPQAGIDFEPNLPRERLQSIAVTRSKFENNAGAGILIYTGPLDATSEPLSILIDRCSITSDKGNGIEIGGTGKGFPTGSVEFRDCTIRKVFGMGLNLFNKSMNSYRPVFTRCTWENVAFGGQVSPFVLDDWDRQSSRIVGGAEYKDCTLIDSFDRPFMAATEHVKRLGSGGFFGKLVVQNPFGAKLDVGPVARPYEWRIEERN